MYDITDPEIIGENPNKSLEGIKTTSSASANTARFRCENPNKSLEGIKTIAFTGGVGDDCVGENPNKSLEGIKTPS